MKKKRVVLGISSGIAAYKVLDLIPLLQKENLDVVVMMTPSAAKMVSPEELVNLTKNKIYIDLFPSDFSPKTILDTRHVDHIDLADSADLVTIVPATANIIGKLAHGIADDFVTTTTLAVTCPVLVCPSMNVHMWQHPAVQENIQALKRFGYHIMEPDEGNLACGYEGKGRLPEVSFIARSIVLLLHCSQILKGKRILVTTGGTQEKIDDVRFITNRSSGKMGTAIADACYEYGGEVTLLRSSTSVSSRYSVKERIFESSNDLMNLVRDEIKSVDIMFHVAAVSDFSVRKNGGKLTSSQKYTVQLVPQQKILDQIKKWNPKVKLFAFKAEYGLSEKALIDASLKRLHESHADAIIANDISKPDRGFGVDTNEVIIVFPNGKTHKIPLQEKSDVARKIIEIVILGSPKDDSRI